ncbi:MAG: N-acetyltransferase [Acidimicrobiales bacterium]
MERATTTWAIRPEQHADHEEIGDVVAAAFGSRVQRDLVDRIRASSTYIPHLALVAEVGGAIVGHVMVSGAILRSEAGDRTIAMLSPLAVAPDHQGVGIGGALVRTALQAADRRGEPLVVLEGSPRYYPRFGFVPAVPHGIHIDLPSWASPEAAQVALLGSYRPDDPTLRGQVVHPPAFDGLD